jgi:hypothetical protein
MRLRELRDCLIISAMVLVIGLTIETVVLLCLKWSQS